MPKFDDMIVAPGFIMTRPDGTAAAALAVSGEGAPCLTMFDDRGKSRLLLNVDSETGLAGMHLMDGGEALVLSAAANVDGTGFVEFKQDGLTQRIAIVYHPDGGPGIIIRDREGAVVWTAPPGVEYEIVVPRSRPV